MNDLIKKIKSMKNTRLSIEIDNRIKDFENFQSKPSRSWFSELCFCILTANSSAESGIKAQKSINDENLCSYPFEKLRESLKSTGYRFYNKRAEYIIKNQKYCKNLKEIITNLGDSIKRRDWLVDNVIGLGYKESSHFLRNIGFKDIAIIDRHIINILYENDYIKDKKINRKRYIKYENILRAIAEYCNMDLARLDLYLWYIETHKVLK